MADPCQKEKDDVKKALEDWRKAVRAAEEKRQAAEHKYLLFTGGVIAGGGVAALACLASVGAMLAATTAAQVGAAFSASVAADVTVVTTAVSNRFGVDEALLALSDAEADEEAAWQQYLDALRRLEHCRKAHHH